MPSLKLFKRIVRAAIVVAIVVGGTMFGTLVRDDWIGGGIGFAAGLILGVVLVYAEWTRLAE